jgi:TDG/mug DNA glycosylase family protein
MTQSKGFPPIARRDARVLILGSLPGQKSIEEQQYYAHPRNAFWPIMHAIFGISGSYATRSAQLAENSIALWDVLSASVRPGSLDADIQSDTAQSNDFESFLNHHDQVELIVFNGKKSEQLFAQLVSTEVSARQCLLGLPSTSPAYAAMPYAKKLQKWQAALQPILKRR